MTVPTSVTEALSLEGLEGVDIQQFIGTGDMKRAIKSRSKKLQAGSSSNQYLIFRPVTMDDLEKIDRERHTIGKHTRMTHYTDTDMLVVKLMPSTKHEAAHLSFAEEWTDRVKAMGLTRRDYLPLGAGRFCGRRSSKEGDSAYKPSTRKNANDWPTFVIESGLSESLRCLRSDAEWWLKNSQGEMKIVIVIAICLARTTIQIEKWELAPVAERRPSARAFPNNPDIPPQDRPQIPTKIQAITINPNSITGPTPLVLEFQKCFLRPAVPPEGDFIFTAQGLSDWAAYYWDLTR